MYFIKTLRSDLLQAIPAFRPSGQLKLINIFPENIILNQIETWLLMRTGLMQRLCKEQALPERPVRPFAKPARNLGNLKSLNRSVRLNFLLRETILIAT